MPNCFSLTKKSDDRPERLQVIDEEMCKHFDAPCDPKFWYCSWYDVIGFSLAIGQTFADLRKEYEEKVAADDGSDRLGFNKRTLEIINWLDEHFVANAWAEIGGRR